LARSFLLPFRKDALGIQRRKLLLDPIFKLKVQGYFLVGVLVSQNGNRLARIVIAVVKEKDDFSTNFFLETPGCRDLSEQKSLRKKSARLLAETNNRVIHDAE
jgi:hypothetical protein